MIAEPMGHSPDGELPKFGHPIYGIRYFDTTELTEKLDEKYHSLGKNGKLYVYYGDILDEEKKNVKYLKVMLEWVNSHPMQWINPKNPNNFKTTSGTFIMGNLAASRKIIHSGTVEFSTFADYLAHLQASPPGHE
nr:hypothetical protein [Candidatus Sigynarchaeota archaeon]